MIISMKTAEIRSAFIQFFADRGHHIVPGASLIPANDPTLLFTNSGMVQFKDVFLGNQQVDYTCAVSVQPSVRAGGKHNDLENVGFTARHHTFFEMLGNFSFGAYFKQEAIRYAWDFLTQVLQLPPEKLWVTVHHEDKESEKIWFQDIGINQDRFSRLDADNFWQMGDTGPCGPCTEIFYDHGPQVAGGPPGSADADGDRYIEIWNLVFMQFFQNEQGEMQPLPRPAVDTGMGLERIAAVLQQVHSNYEIDDFVCLLQAIQACIQNRVNQANNANNATALPNTTDALPDVHIPSMHVIADHLRSACFLIADGILPGNEGRSYVLRRIIRRAVRHGYQLGIRAPFLHDLVPTLISIMDSAYPRLAAQQEQICNWLQQEEQQFFVTLHKGMQMLDHYLQQYHVQQYHAQQPHMQERQTQQNQIQQHTAPVLPGDIVFKLYDTYGFPVDITEDLAKEKGFTLDMTGFEQAMIKQQQQARSQQKFRQQRQFLLQDYATTDFVGYTQMHYDSKILALFDAEQQPVTQLTQGQKGTVLLDATPFYAESGGQIGDQGYIGMSDHGDKQAIRFRVEDTQKQGAYYLHHGVMLAGILHLQGQVQAQTDTAQRHATACNHSATHLLHAALRQILGAHVQQKGSLVRSDDLRFDFSHPQPLTSEQIQQVQQRVHQQICANSPVQTEIMSLEQAKQKGAMALFGEKYTDPVRVLTMGQMEQNDQSKPNSKLQPFSVELCGGTHVEQTGEIHLFHIIRETGIAAGIRRIEAVTGKYAYQYLMQQLHYLEQASQQLKTNPEKLATKITQLIQQNKQQQKQLESLQQQIDQQSCKQLLHQAEDMGQGIKLLIHRDDSLDSKSMKAVIDQLKNTLPQAVICLASSLDHKPVLVTAVTQNMTDRVHAGKLIQYLAQQIGGKGGGRADMAQGGGSDSAHLEQALASIRPWVQQALR